MNSLTEPIVGGKKVIRSLNWYHKAYTILIEHNVKLVGDSEARKYFEVVGKSGVHSVIYYKPKQLWLCSCTGKSFWFVSQPHCSHTKACQIAKIIIFQHKKELMEGLP